jgi:hypothetical protein
MTEPPAPPTSSNSRALVAWDHYQRWFLRGRVFRLAVQSRLLTLATAGVLLTIFGWWGLAHLFSGTDERPLLSLLPAYEICPWQAADAAAVGNGAGLTRVAELSGPELGQPPSDAFVDPWLRLSAPFRQLFALTQTFTGAAFLLLAAVWASAVWALFGGAITRAVVVHLTREEAISLGSASTYARSRWVSYFAAPLFPLIGVVLVAVPMLGLGWLMRLSLLAAGLLWPLALLAGLVSTILLAGLSVGWPLMHAAISAEGRDGFDALSRTYSYVYQRPLNYLLYAVSATLLGLLGLFVVDLFAAAVAHLAAWSVSWGSGRDLMLNALDPAAKHVGLDAWGARLIWFWQRLTDVVVLGYAFAFFWTASTAIYLLLRHDVDGVTPDEVFLDDTETFGLPPLAVDAAGVPVVPPEPSASPSTG